VDDPNGSSRGTHNYPSPNAARSHTHFADNLCPGCHSHAWPSSWTGASSSELVYACSRVVQVTDTRTDTPRLLTRTHLLTCCLPTTPYHYLPGPGQVRYGRERRHHGQDRAGLPPIMIRAGLSPIPN